MRHILLNVGMGVRLILRSKVRVVVVLTLAFGVGFILERKSEKGGICAKSSTKVNGKRRLKIRMASRPINWSSLRGLRDGLVIPRLGSIKLSDM